MNEVLPWKNTDPSYIYIYECVRMRIYACVSLWYVWFCVFVCTCVDIKIKTVLGQFHDCKQSYNNQYDAVRAYVIIHILQFYIDLLLMHTVHSMLIPLMAW